MAQHLAVHNAHLQQQQQQHTSFVLVVRPFARVHGSTATFLKNQQANKCDQLGLNLCLLPSPVKGGVSEEQAMLPAQLCVHVNVLYSEY
jgi:hypothetical protein